MYLAPIRSRARKNGRPFGFTLVEVLVATALLGLLAGGAIWALVQANNYASINRLYTGAQTVAQNRIDQILSDGPFNPQNNEFPAVLKIPLDVGGTATDVVDPEIYNEPNPANGTPHIIYGKLTTSVSKVTATGINGVDLNLYSATVVVTYTFRGKPYRVQLNAMRASDL
jgi:prepilin-type N-terminal cleavage/methylation domain-containing protein